MGDEIFLVLKLIDDEQFALAGTVVWVTPADAQSSRTRGVGVEFKGPEGKRPARTSDGVAGGFRYPAWGHAYALIYGRYRVMLIDSHCHVGLS